VLQFHVDLNTSKARLISFKFVINKDQEIVDVFELGRPFRKLSNFVVPIIDITSDIVAAFMQLKHVE
jgi:hypothetical protein